VLRVVLDANVYVSAFVRPEGPPGQIVERLLRNGAFEVVLSAAIVEEVLRALAYPKVLKSVRTKVEPDLWFEDIVLLAEFVTDHEIAAVSKDPDDDKYIAAAIEGRASFVVSGDPDLLDVKEHEGVRIVNPRGFLAQRGKGRAHRE
jgi:putative PIN family toxin of toxin-antitoxin system